MLARLPLTYTVFGRAASGPPQPTIFATHPRDTRAFCLTHPENLQAGMEKLWARFFSPENLTLEDAVAAVHRPREGSIYRPWSRIRLTDESREPLTGPPPRAADLAGNSKKVFIPIPLHMKFNKSNAAWLEVGGKVGAVQGGLEKNFSNRVAEGSAKNTWARHHAVQNSFDKFCASENCSENFPLTNEIIQNYASWCDVNRNLKADSIKTYLYSLSKIQQIKGHGPIDFKKIPRLKDFLRGVKNLPKSNRKIKKRKAVSFPMLRLLGSEICKSNWSGYDKTLTWTSFLLSYFGSLRISELLSEETTVFDRDKTLCWKDVVFSDDGVTLRLRSPKVEHAGGDLICLFPFPVPGLCPVAALRRLREKAKAAGLFDREEPVFRLEGGACWKRAAFNSTLRSVVERTGVSGEDSKVTGHSFRGGIPSLLALQASPAAEAALKEWGRWRSQAYESYTQFHIATRKNIFGRITKLLLK
jgi:hypothetical protein